MLPVRVRLFAVLALALAATPVAARQSPAAATDKLWVGQADATWMFAPDLAFDARDWNGAMRDARSFHLRLKETRTREINDADGRLIGTIIFLEDAGTTWTGVVGSTETHLGAIRLTADGAGEGTASVNGVVYRSAVTDNPLADVLPDGAYALVVTPSGITYESRVIENGKVIDQSRGTSMNALMIGDSKLAFRLAMAASPLTETTIRAAMRLEPPGQMPGEGKSRQLEHNAIDGSYSIVGTGDAKGTTSVASWHVASTFTVDATLTETPKPWRPTLNDFVTYTASIDPSLGPKRFRFTLSDVSHETGTALNRGFDQSPDLTFDSSQPQPMSTVYESPDHATWTIETTTPASSASVAVMSTDYGAWGRLSAQVFVDGAWYDAKTSRGAAFASVPLDDNHNHIADDWEENAGIPGHPASEDADSMPTGANRGDGLSNYEEYRGFYVGSDWTDTDPTIKDIFVNNEASTDGCGYTHRSGLVCRLIQTDEYSDDRVINFNRGFASAGEQRGLRITSLAQLAAEGITETIAPGAVGQAYPAVGVPNDVTYIVLEMDRLARFMTYRQVNSTTFVLDPVTRNSVTAHEIGHGIDLNHHGPYGIGGTCAVNTTDLVSYWGGAMSGDRACVMSYSGANRYIWRDGTCHDWIWGEEWGKDFCANRSGTGINAAGDRDDNGHPLPAAGDATAGDCLHTLRLKK
jgi:hypothetical protein